MNTFQLSWKNLRYKPLSTLLILVLFSLGVGLISLLLLVENQLRENFEKNLAGVNLVVGAKGSPLQLILSSMYHIDAPTGNITLKEARPFLNPKHPFIDQAIPISLGDNHKGYRLVGTSQEILKLYNAKVGSGKVWERNFEVNIGANVAKELNMNIGDEFKSSHGFVDEVDMKHDHAQAFKVVGILAPTGSVIDQLLLTTTQSFWLVHEHGEEEHHEEGEEDHEHGAEHEHDHDDNEYSDHKQDDHAHTDEHHDHEDGDHEHHDQSDDHDHEAASNAIPKPIFEENDSAEITSLLIKFKALNFQTLNMQRNINENTDLQAATPAIEIARLYTLMGAGEQVLRIMAIVIIFVAGLSIFISLYSSLKERKYELALMRVMGAAQRKLFFLVITEGMLLALIGFVIGTLLSHLGMQLLASFMKDAYRYSFTAFQFLPQEWFLLMGALLFGFIAAVIPAIQASRTDISETLTQG
ncbi:MAG TPA: FtsX-like permease family protein [Haliscomenobacter sp.]|uniref:ABC transporter permease n=1 Tax=Haliscomenobacter sp. TaxID=2717303 RepID=UPI002BE589EA|nr:FtsX-like permease family protein [Haliscomenobacter sp.]HOY16084.1 FtsX-like permease family protein [Haliscomenobacter sp.]